MEKILTKLWSTENKFLLTDDLMLQSQANHSHRGDVVRELEKNPKLIGEKTKQIEQIITNWRTTLDAHEISQTQGYTFYICADDSIMISVISGTGHPVIYGGRFEKFNQLMIC